MGTQSATFLWISFILFSLTFIILFLFPVEVYEKAKVSNISTINKGRFAYTVDSLYHIKSEGLEADGKYWWHVIWFNGVVSASVSAIVVFGIIVLLVVLGIILVILIAPYIFN